jgi:hypothetical protein
MRRGLSDAVDREYPGCLAMRLPRTGLAGQEALLEEGARMTLKEAAGRVVRAAGEPLTVEELTRRILAEGHWRTKGRTPQATVAAQFYTEIKRHGDASPLVRVGPNPFGLRAERGAVPPEPTDGNTPGRRTPRRSASGRKAPSRRTRQLGTLAGNVPCGGLPSRCSTSRRK